MPRPCEWQIARCAPWIPLVSLFLAMCSGERTKEKRVLMINGVCGMSTRRRSSTYYNVFSVVALSRCTFSAPFSRSDTSAFIETNEFTDELTKMNSLPSFTSTEMRCLDNNSLAKVSRLDNYLLLLSLSFFFVFSLFFFSVANLYIVCIFSNEIS